MTQDFRRTPPAPLAPVAFNVPEAFRTVLGNGLRLTLFSDRRLPLLNLRFIFRHGDVHEARSANGLTSATSAMLNEGTERYSSRQLAEEIERLGASLGASSGADSTVVAASALSLYAEDVLQLLREVLMAPTFPESELELYKQNTVEGLKFQRSQPSFLADEQFARSVYGGHPYGTVSPSAADIERLEREMLVENHRRIFGPSGACLVAVGDFDIGEFVALVERLFRDWQGGAEPAEDFPGLPLRSSRKLIVVDRPGSAQANILIGNSAIGRNHPDFFPALVLNQVLGAGASSRLFMNLREEKGYTYGAYSKFNARKFGGDFEASAEVRTEVVGKSLDEFVYEMDRIRSEKVPQTELKDAIDYLTGVFPLRAETQEGLTNLLVHQEVYGLPETYLSSYRDRVAAVTAADVQRVAREQIRPDGFTFVIVGDGREIVRQSAAFCDEVSAFDSEGRQIDVAMLSGGSSDDGSSATGRWELEIEFQGRPVNAVLELTSDEGTLGGRIETPLGGGEVKGGSLSGGRLRISAAAELAGGAVDLSIEARLEGDALEGEISSAMIPAPLPFKAVRVKKDDA